MNDFLFSVLVKPREGKPKAALNYTNSINVLDLDNQQAIIILGIIILLY